MSRVTNPLAGSGPPATVSRSGAPVASGAAASATRPGDRCTATGRFPAGAGPLPCSQYREKTGWAGSGGAPPGPGGTPPGSGGVLSTGPFPCRSRSGPARFRPARSPAGSLPGGQAPNPASARVTVPAAGTATSAVPSTSGSAGPSASSSRLVRRAVPGAVNRRTRAAEAATGLPAPGPPAPGPPAPGPRTGACDGRTSSGSSVIGAPGGGAPGVPAASPSPRPPGAAARAGRRRAGSPVASGPPAWLPGR